MLERRSVIQGLAGALAAPLLRARPAGAAVPLTTGLPAGEYETAALEALPGKRPLIKLSYRPPNYETPLSYFGEALTPNDVFFVRYHLAGIPEATDAETWKLAIAGECVENPLTLTIADLRSGFEPVEIEAVCQCSGNRRGLSDPHVPGVQWGLGAMGNARWQGARLKDILAKAGLKKDAIEIVVKGADAPVLDTTPGFVKSLPAWRALDENTIVAYAMNGSPLPHFNGAPVRLIVPGWTATYWMKHLVSVEAVAKPFDGFWMKSAYRIPIGKFPVVDRFVSQEAPGVPTTPITEIVINSLVLTPDLHQRAGLPVELDGIAWDAGYGIARVEISTDGGADWQQATLDEERSRFGFRRWRYRFTPPKPGSYTVLAKASNHAGQTQADRLIFNPAGYHNNVPRPSMVIAT
jgi:DMSO/TMAO reductase YedYZ molybdopterin-dependent catalytic subunit